MTCVQVYLLNLSSKHPRLTETEHHFRCLIRRSIKPTTKVFKSITFNELENRSKGNNLQPKGLAWKIYRLEHREENRGKKLLRKIFL